jgi:16S rRNA (guanine(966)-N(2))-methyltransferase RsmD
LRVIGGEYRGRRLRAPSGISTRPTSDRVREALFDILARHVPGATFLDAYAGSGAVGIEALSRGAAECVFVESGHGAASLLASNLASLRIADRASVLEIPFVQAAERLAGAEKTFDLVFIDPPYRRDEVPRSLALVASKGLLATGGLLIAEHDAGETLPGSEGNLRRIRSVKYGGTRLTFYDSVVDSGGPDP